MNVVIQARQFVMGVIGLSNEERIYLKQLLNRGTIIPSAVIDSNIEDLREIIEHNPPRQKNTGHSYTYILIIIENLLTLPSYLHRIYFYRVMWSFNYFYRYNIYHLSFNNGLMGIFHFS